MDNNWLFKFAPVFIAIIGVIIVLYCIATVVFLIYTGVHAVGQNGLHGILSQLWCGADPSCKSPF